MFGRRRRRLAAAITTSVPELGNEQIFALLHGKIAELVGQNGAWTLVPRRSDDTDTIFHGLKAQQIATDLTELLSREQAALRGETAAEPTALSWTPAPITIWVEPTPEPVAIGQASVVAGVEAAAATLASARLVA